MVFGNGYTSEEACFGPKHALVIHQDSASGQWCSGKATLITSHPVQQTDDGPVIGAGSLLSLADYEVLRDILINSTESRPCLLPPNLLYQSARRLVWYVTGRVAPMFLRIGSRLQKIQVPWPTLLFSVESRRLSVAALAGTTRPREDTPLFHAPIANVYARGEVCTGNAELPASWGVRDMAGWEAAIYSSAFTHINAPHTLRLPGVKTVDNKAHFAFWRELARKKSTRFPRKHLQPMKRTLGSWLRDGSH